MEQADRLPGDRITTHRLWGNADATWAGKPVLAAILNGAQGDDDEAHGGHFGIVTGRVGPHGEWADWIVNNFYDADVVSEKGILPAMVPMDNYLMDLNSGQSYYRPSALLVLVLKQDRIPAAYQTNIQDVFLNYARRERMPVHIRLMTGQEIEGRIKNFDRFALIVETDGTDQLVFKHAIATLDSRRSVTNYFSTHHS